MCRASSHEHMHVMYMAHSAATAALRSVVQRGSVPYITLWRWYALLNTTYQWSAVLETGPRATELRWIALYSTFRHTVIHYIAADNTGENGMRFGASGTVHSTVQHCTTVA